ncbi:polyketide cyclase [Clostridium sp. MCC353]|uniref:SRPBCC family protein n=1 Tax=Clostridium sp. MCC353 TaxID=2592646 RepID=UPI001C02012F|nr:SRPBCC family protein [Clostridium sp. MCC353]MBT9775036.1 polyketide cyclase [Clostridium sp. MCC353]
MMEARIRTVFDCPVERIWAVVTDLENYGWRSDLSRIEAAEDGKHFVEYAKNGYATNFVITASKPPCRYEFDMENDNMAGHWTGIFTVAEEGTVLDFRECVEVKKWIMKPFAGIYLRIQQRQYMKDLRRALKDHGRA